jgi:ubiquitin-like modifier-activating enzyme ATG7
MTTIQYVPFSSEIELPFYPAFFASKLDHDKLDESARQVVGAYEPSVAKPADSAKMYIKANALTSHQ